MHMLGSVTAPKGTLPLWRGGLWVLYQASWKLGNQENKCAPFSNNEPQFFYFSFCMSANVQV